MVRITKFLLAALIATAPIGGVYAIPSDDSIAPMLEDVLPAVVNISVHGTTEMQPHPLMEDPFFRRFFGEGQMPGEQEFQAAGSGVIIDADEGLIVTSAHVLEGADRVMVTLSTGQRMEAALVGLDADSDVAVIRVSPDPDVTLHSLPLADSTELRVGDFVAAVGNPFGLNQTVSTGIVSAMGRSGLGIQGYEDFIQTDASINPGHSGGALVNMDGELVGINSAILAPMGGNIGIGFAVPVNMVEVVFEQLVEHGEVRRGELGVMAQDLTPEIAESMELDLTQGALIAQVRPGSPAAEAGLQDGDVVVEVNGVAIGGASDLRNQIGLLEIGDEVEITFERDGERITEAAVLAQAPVEGEPPAAVAEDEDKAPPQAQR